LTDKEEFLPIWRGRNEQPERKILDPNDSAALDADNMPNSKSSKYQPNATAGGGNRCSSFRFEAPTGETPKCLSLQGLPPEDLLCDPSDFKPILAEILKYHKEFHQGFCGADGLSRKYSSPSHRP
jgi:hypothetical protein